MKRIRTVNEAYNEIKVHDPDTAISKHFFRSLIDSGKIPCIKVGSKSLVDMDAVESCINSLFVNERNTQNEHKEIL